MLYRKKRGRRKQYLLSMGGKPKANKSTKENNLYFDYFSVSHIVFAIHFFSMMFLLKKKAQKGVSFFARRCLTFTRQQADC